MKAYLFFLFFLFFSGFVFGQNRTIDSLEKVITTTKVDTVKGRSLCRLCEGYNDKSEYKKSREAGIRGLEICERVNDKEGSIICLRASGLCELSVSNFYKALEFFQKSLARSKELSSPQNSADALLDIGNCELYIGNYPQALASFNESLKISTQLGNKSRMARNLNNIGNIYNRMGKISQAFEYYQKCRKINEEIRDTLELSKCITAIGSVYLAEGKFSLALAHFEKSLVLTRRSGGWADIGSAENNLGAIYQHVNNFTKAMEHYRKGLIIHEQIGNIASVSNSCGNIASCFLQMNQSAAAKPYAHKALELARRIHHMEWMYFGAEVSYQIDSALGDYQSAFVHHKLYKQYSDSLNNEDKAKEFGKIESKYEFEKQAETEKRLEQEKAKIEAAEKERRDNLQYLTIFAGIIGLFTGLLFIGKLKIPTKITEVLIFAGLLLTFEFLLIFFDPYFEKFSGGIPFYKLGFNTLIAFGFAPLHSFLESKLKRRLVKGENP